MKPCNISAKLPVLLGLNLMKPITDVKAFALTDSTDSIMLVYQLRLLVNLWDVLLWIKPKQTILTVERTMS